MKKGTTYAAPKGGSKGGMKGGKGGMKGGKGGCKRCC